MCKRSECYNELKKIKIKVKSDKHKTVDVTAEDCVFLILSNSAVKRVIQIFLIGNQNLTPTSQTRHQTNEGIIKLRQLKS